MHTNPTSASVHVCACVCAVCHNPISYLSNLRVFHHCRACKACPTSCLQGEFHVWLYKNQQLEERRADHSWNPKQTQQNHPEPTPHIGKQILPADLKAAVLKSRVLIV